MNSELLDKLRRLDPAGQEAPPVATPEDQELLAILAQPREQDKRPHPAPKRTASRALVAVAASVAAVAIGVGVFAPWGATPSFASWTAVPQELSAAEVAIRVAECPSEHPDFPGASLEPVLLDVRGDYTFAIFADDEVMVQCYLETAADGAVLASTAEAGPSGEAPEGPGITAVSNGVTSWTFGPGDGGAVALAYGRAAEDVEAIELTLDDDQAVTASVEGGWWAVWVPGDSPLPDTATVTVSNGHSEEVAIR